MKYVSFIVPCYNSSAYMSNCIDSIVHLGNDVEVLIVDDGSTKDNTLEVAKQYEKKYPDICKAIHKENGGHGDALMVGLANATGLYTRVVDSDDWLGKTESRKYLKTIKDLVDKKTNVDMIVTNFVYDKVDAKHKKVMKYNFSLPKNKVITWDETLIFPPGVYMLMHSLTYRTKVLRDCELNLPKKTFYVDNIYAYKPLPFVKKLFYLDVNLYHYFIGRDDQSVNEKVMIGRLEQQFRVTKLMLYGVNLDKIKSKKLLHYMHSYMSIIMTVTSILSIISKDDHWLDEKENLWQELKKVNKKLYHELMYSFLGIGVNLPGEPGRRLAAGVYKLSQMIYGFN